MAERHDLLAQIAANKRRTVYVMAGFALLITAVVAVFDLAFAGGPVFIAIAIVVVLAMVWASYFYSDKLAIAASHAREADPDHYRQLHNIVEGLCLGVGLPKPRLYIVDDPAPNAFATGRNPRHAAVAVTSGLLEKMNRIELEGVLAHELSHIKNYDILVSTLAVTMVGFTAVLADIGVRAMWWGMGRETYGDWDDDNGGDGFGPLAIVGVVLLALAPFVAQLMQLAIGRRRETLADVSGVEMTRYPPGLIAALEKLKDDSTVVHAASHATSHLWIEEPAAQSPEEGKLSRINRLFA